MLNIGKIISAKIVVIVLERSGGVAGDIFSVITEVYFS